MYYSVLLVYILTELYPMVPFPSIVLEGVSDNARPLFSAPTPASGSTVKLRHGTQAPGVDYCAVLRTAVPAYRLVTRVECTLVLQMV